MLPIGALSIFGIVMLFVGFLKNRQVLLPLAQVIILIALVLLGLEYREPFHNPLLNNGMMELDSLAMLFGSVILLTGIFVMPLSERYLYEKNAQPAEYYAILLFSLVGAIMMVSFQNLIMLFVGVEILSISMYVLAGADKRSYRSNEAALKYFLMGAFFTGIMLFGFALLYGASGSFAIADMRDLMYDASETTMKPMVYMGILFVLIGLLFKVSAAPFHFWTPDVYDGSPTFFTAFMSTVVKTAGFAAIYRLLLYAFGPLEQVWVGALIVSAILTLVIANLTATNQKSFKRMMAYSGVAHAGYMLIAVAAYNERSMEAIFFYSLAYSLATISAFAVLIKVSEVQGSEDFDAFRGLHKTNPFLAFVLTVAMCSLAGIPLTAGFFGKLYVFLAALSEPGAPLAWMVVVAVIMSAVGIYYYFRVVIAMYMKPGNDRPIAISPRFQVVLLATTGLTLLLGIAPSLLSGLVGN